MKENPQHLGMGKQQDSNAPATPPSVKIPKITLILSILVLAALVIFVVTHVGDAEHFAKLVESAEPVWLIGGIGLQLGTYLCAGAIWGAVVRAANHKLRVTALARLALEKRSVDQVVPTGGIAGNLVVFQAMRNLGLPNWLAMEALLMDTLAYYAAFLVAIIASLLAIGLQGAMTNAILYLVAGFSIILVGVPAAIFWFLKHKDRKPPRWLLRIKPVVRMLEMAESVSPERVVRPVMLTITGSLNMGIFLLDGLTLWAMMHAIGLSVSPVTTFVALIMGTVAGAVSFLPGGIGGFEVGATTALTLLGVPMEAALTGTLLLRGFSLWLPLAPGLWFARRDVRIRVR